MATLIRTQPSPEVFEGVDVELVEGDLYSPATDDKADNGKADDGSTEGIEPESCPTDSIDEAIGGCDAVIHCAGLIHLGWTQMERSMQVNCEGTRRIVESCLRHGKKLIYIGTVDSIAVGTRDSPADEMTPLANAGGQIPSAYVLSKTAGLEVVTKAVDRGLDTVILHPGFMLGPWDWKPSSGQMVVELSKGWKMVAPSGGCSVCDSRDVASATIRALDLDGPSGRQFILAGANWTYKKLWTELAKRFGRPAPIMGAGPGQRFIGGWFGDLVTKLTGKEPYLNSASVAMSSQFHWYHSKRAHDELGYQSRDPHESIDDSVAWIREQFLNES